MKQSGPVYLLGLADGYTGIHKTISPTLEIKFQNRSLRFSTMKCFDYPILVKNIIETK